MENRDLIGAIREAVKASGMKNATVAKKLGMSEPHVWMFVNGKRSISAKYLHRIMDLFGLEVRKKQS